MGIHIWVDDAAAFLRSERKGKQNGLAASIARLLHDLPAWTTWVTRTGCGRPAPAVPFARPQSDRNSPCQAQDQSSPRRSAWTSAPQRAMIASDQNLPS